MPGSNRTPQIDFVSKGSSVVTVTTDAFYNADLGYNDVNTFYNDSTSTAVTVTPAFGNPQSAIENQKPQIVDLGVKRQIFDTRT